MRWLLVLFVVVPLTELYLLLAIGQLIGFWPTVLLTLVTALVGGTLAKREGTKVLRAWRDALARQEAPSQGVLDGVLVLLGGALLVTPGVLTDVTGLLMLFPTSRGRIANRVRRAVDERIAAETVQVVTVGGFGPGGPGEPGGPGGPLGAAAPRRANVIETQGESVDPE